MVDALPPISLTMSDAGAPQVVVDGTPVQDIAGLAAAVPDITDPHWVKVYAWALNHVAHGYKFEVILDPPAYEARFMEEWDAEDPEEPAVAGVPRLRSYGKPDFSAITLPAYDGQELVFYARETYLGIPYKVTMSIDAAPVYAPMALTRE